MSAKTATLVRKLDGFQGDARLYKVEPPASYNDWDGDDEVQRTTPYVVVSAADVPYSGPETYIFPADEAGEIANWLELHGSFRGGFDHVEALRLAGYEVTA